MLTSGTDPTASGSVNEMLTSGTDPTASGSINEMHASGTDPCLAVTKTKSTLVGLTHV